MAETTAPRTGDRRRLAIIAAAGLSALALLLWMAIGQTTAGFTATTTNSGNLFTAGSITITSDKPGQVVLSASNLLPGDSVSGDITITNGADAPLKLAIWSSGLTENDAPPSATNGISENLNVTITRTAPGATVPVFDGTLAELAADHTTFATGASGTAGGDPLAKAGQPDDATTYHWVVELDPGAGMPSRMVDPGDKAEIDITFEGRA